jgi:pseudoazurin
MKYILMSLMSFMFTLSVFSKEFVIDMLNKRDDGQRMVFSKDVVSVALGDTVKWVPTEPGHNVEFVSGPEGVELPPKSYINKEFSMKFETPGIYLYVCSPHSIMGMIGLVIVDNDTSNKDAILAYDIGGRANKKLKALLSEL